MFGESGRENKKEKSRDYKVDMDNRKLYLRHANVEYAHLFRWNAKLC